MDETAGWLTGLGLVFALDLEDVEEVCGRGVDLDEVFIVLLGDGLREFCYTELLGRLLIRACEFSRLFM